MFPLGPLHVLGVSRSGLVSVAKNLLGLCVVADPDYKWDQVLKLLYANVPEELYVWISNMKQVLAPLVERVQDLMQALP